MLQDRLICIDIETVPDRRLIPGDWPSDKFPNLIHHRVITVAFLEARIARDHDGRERYFVECCRCGGENEDDEARLLQGFWRYFFAAPSKLCTWGGRGYDVATLKLRSMIHGLSAESWFKSGSRWENYGSRFCPDFHTDLMDIFAEHGAAHKLKLDDVAKAFGFPGKIGADGSKVQEMYDAGRQTEIDQYAEVDVLNTFCIYLRWARLSGLVDKPGYKASMASLRDLLEREAPSRPNFAEFLERLPPES